MKQQYLQFLFRKQDEGKPKKRKGFTMIEMLVVIAVIAVMVAIIIPVVGYTTRKANAATNAANLRSIEGMITQDMLLHSGEFAEYLETGKRLKNWGDQIDNFANAFGIDLGVAQLVEDWCQTATAVDGVLEFTLINPHRVFLRYEDCPTSKKVDIIDASGAQNALPDGVQITVYLSQDKVKATFNGYTVDQFADISDNGILDGSATYEGDDGNQSVVDWATIEWCKLRGKHAPDPERSCQCPNCKQHDHDTADVDKDHKCDRCKNKTISECADGSTKDHMCDTCGKGPLSECVDNSGSGLFGAGGPDGKCDICGETVAHECQWVRNQTWGGTDNHKCSICGETGEHSDAGDDGDHKCDKCTMMFDCPVTKQTSHSCSDCGASSPCTDKSGDGDHICDFSGCNERVPSSVCVDEKKPGSWGSTVSGQDGKCDECGEPVAHPHAWINNNNSNHKCSICGTTEPHSDAENDGNHTCDAEGCGRTITSCSDAATDGDHLCDECTLPYGSCSSYTSIDDSQHECTDCHAPSNHGNWKQTSGNTHSCGYSGCTFSAPCNNTQDTDCTTCGRPATGSGGGNCVTPDTLITLADGTQKRVEELTGNELLLVWNLETGMLDAAPILFVDNDEEAFYEVIKLYFSDGTEVKVISEHGFWDYDLNKYVYLDRNAEEYIGHWFFKHSGNGGEKVQLVDVVLEVELTTAWSPVTVGHLCYFVNDMLSMPGGVGGLFNFFDVDPETMTYDYEAMARDIETYGLFTYEELNAIVELPREMFDAAGGAYLKVSIGKGNMTIDELIRMIQRYSVFFQ